MRKASQVIMDVYSNLQQNNPKATAFYKLTRAPNKQEEANKHANLSNFGE